MKRIMITGALGQIGSELTLRLRDLYGANHVLATDVRMNDSEAAKGGPFERVDVLDGKRLGEVATSYRIDTIIHLAALLSATGESNPVFAWNLNMGGLLNALETARELNCQFFSASSIGAFGPDTPKVQTPQITIQRPNTMYGVNKVAAELLSQYYFTRFGVDTRGLRFPGLISYVTPPGGGTTDYAVEIFYEAVRSGSYISYIAKDTYMDMMYMPDALDAIIQLMEEDGSRLNHRNAYNVSAMSVDPEEIAASIRKVMPHFTLSYKVDPIRQRIAESWPNCIDSTAAKQEWGFDPKFRLEEMTRDMLQKLALK
ncbi:NAD-dependent epimerase/dehydratase family protein [Mesobacillus foraminis]|uniref:NAD-dependent epimerase/dehydratase family protein n=1 Tax=Mesobacillus foraminis TaxID=279826 RepID=UPI001BEBD464|nr:NAD-dependent epimerase/dehydratase family protein [Mesobacillus foraminis]MBT2755088.1 NAD-dependent epimerase/dehydratase family protein [Mesobacillus foraminis]